MIIAGSLTGLSIGKLFLAGAIPGLLLAMGLMSVSFIISRKRNHPKQIKASWKERRSGFLHAFWALLMTFLILYGIIGGMFTPTEASVVAVLYALVIGSFIYKTLNFKKIYQCHNNFGRNNSIFNDSGWFCQPLWMDSCQRKCSPGELAAMLLSITENKYLLLLLINLLLIFIGSFMETIAALLIVYPILLKVAVEAGVDPIQFSIIAILNLIIGLNTPPVGVCLFVVSGIGKISMDKIVKAGFPFLLVSLLILLLVTYIPALSLFLPGIFN
jgi:C4-dicarboxylate transporter, DctM subunit